MFEERFESHPDDTDVEPDAPVLHIPDITLHALFHLPEFFRSPSESRHLSPARDARLHEVAHHILIDQFRIHLGMGQHVRTGPHHTHVPLDHIPELGELVDIGPAHKITKRELPRVILRGLQLVGLLIHVHRTELITNETLTVNTSAFLFKQQRPRALQFLHHPHQRDQQDSNGQRHHGEQNVEPPLHHPDNRTIQRTLMGRIHFDVVDILSMQVKSHRLYRDWDIEELSHLTVAERRESSDGITLLTRQTDIQLITQIDLPTLRDICQYSPPAIRYQSNTSSV